MSIEIDLFVMVMLQGERYISARGSTFLLMPMYEDMIPDGTTPLAQA